MSRACLAGCLLDTAVEYGEFLILAVGQAAHDRDRHLAVQQPERRGTGGGGGTGAGGETGAVAPLALDVALADFGRRLVHAACFCLASAIPSSA